MPKTTIAEPNVAAVATVFFVISMQQAFTSCDDV